MSIETQLSGFLFIFVIVTNIASNLFGYVTFSMERLDPNAELQKISNDPVKFKISFVLIVIEHLSIIALAVMLFIAFNPYNIILGIVWVTVRTGEGTIQIFNKKNYWGLLDIAIQYSGVSGAEKDSLIDSGHSILESKNSNFLVAQILFSIGTLAYSTLFVTSGVVPAIIGWSGIVASIIYGFGCGIQVVKSDVRPHFKVLSAFGGLFILLFELALGGWLLFFS
ncbi:MAG: DUF4386 domain-containing protein [Candidatus Odinarchaeota archaeon]